jgi:hypothetical protein
MEVMTMTILERRPVLARFMGKARFATGVAATLLVMVAGSPALHAAAPPPVAAKPAPSLRKPGDAAATATQPKAPAAKTKPRLRATPKAAKPTAEAAAKPAPAPADKAPAASGKPTQVMDFDNEQVDGQRMEPGFELIQAAPRRARQPSLVKPLRPEDSVVGRE